MAEKKARISAKAITRLGMYWFRAELMHQLLHALMDLYDGDLDRIAEDGHFSELNTYLAYWLSALFVVVEGFNKLQIKDQRVQKLFTAHLHMLKAMRHETYHSSSIVEGAW